MRNTVIPAAYLILKNKDNQVLLSKRQNTGYMDGFYSLPAGHIEHNETAKEGLIREVKEEINITIKPDNLKFVHYCSRIECEPNRTAFFFQAEQFAGEINNNEPEKCSELLWCDVDKLPKNIISLVKNAILLSEKNIHYSESHKL